MNVIGSGSPRKVPKARRMMRSASERSPSLNGRTETSVFTWTIGVLLSSTQPHQVAFTVTMTAKDKAVKGRGRGRLPLCTQSPRGRILGNRASGGRYYRELVFLRPYAPTPTHWHYPLRVQVQGEERVFCSLRTSSGGAGWRPCRPAWRGGC